MAKDVTIAAVGLTKVDLTGRDHYFQIPRGRSFDLSRLVQSIRRRAGGEAGEAPEEEGNQPGDACAVRIVTPPSGGGAWRSEPIELTTP